MGCPGSYVVDGLEVCVPLRDDQSEFIDFTGRHENERQPQRHRVADGTWVREFRRGKPSFESTALIAGTEGFCFGFGSMLGVQPAWSGNTVLAVDRITEDGTAVFVGELLQPGEVVLTTGDTYTTPWIVITACNDGLDGVAHSLHAWERSLPAHPASQPVTLNVWEALYFDQDPDVVLDLVGRAARLGVERFVLDDGWFHARRTDTAGLGDWWVDPSVWPTCSKPARTRAAAPRPCMSRRSPTTASWTRCAGASRTSSGNPARRAAAASIWASSSTSSASGPRT